MQGKFPMSTCDPTLEQFIKFVPHCHAHNPLETIFSSFNHYNSDFLVVVNGKNFPVGILSARTALQAKTEREVLLSPLNELLSPVSLVSENLTIKQLLPYLERVNAQEKILVIDESQQLRGELDTESILQILLREKKVSSTDDSPSEETVSESLDNLSPLFEFLDELPLPLMIQTQEGKLLHQNGSWRENICSNQSNCCLLSQEESRFSQKQWCNVISQTSAVPKNVSGKTSNCRVFPVSAPDPARRATARAEGLEFEQESGGGFPTLKRDSTSGKTLGVWQFITLNLPENKFGSLSLVLATDISEQKQLCKELAAKNADLVQLNRLKDEFLACITHELKSPLTAIVGLSNLLDEKSIGDLNQRQQRYVKQIYQSGRQLMNLVNDLLDLARLETGQLQLHPEVVNLKQVCDRAIEEAKQQTPDSPAQYTFNLEADLNTIVADELRLRQMLVHLLSNARKFTAEEGEMGLEVSQWEGWIAFTVWDTGIGIPEESQHLIFQKFQQLEDPMTRQFSGTGLGLVLTQRLAHAHGGDVSFISEEGKGSQFTLLLPPHPAPKSASSPTHAVAIEGKLVLVVEAVPQYLTKITLSLQGLGYRVAIARSGTEALLKARTFQPCTILLNPVLPFLSGWDVLTLLKSHPKTCHLPVIVTATSGEKQEAMNNGADAALTLPVEKDHLEEALAVCAAPRSVYRQSLTVLRLHYSDVGTVPHHDPITEILSNPPASNPKRINYRILEADDPEQAELLQRIWHPDVLLLTGEKIPYQFIQQVSQQETLPNLPIVCLDSETARVAHQVGKLSVYPCLNLNGTHPHLRSGGSGRSSQSLQTKAPVWSALEFAAGLNPPPRQIAPYVVIADGKRLTKAHPHSSKSEWLNAFIQYLATAGYRSSLSHSWSEVYQQVQQQVADVLLIDLEGARPNSELIQGLKQLSVIGKNLPIVAIAPPKQLLDQEGYHHLLKQIARKILPGYPESMQELLSSLEEQLW